MVGHTKKEGYNKRGNVVKDSSPETQGQLEGAGQSLNGREKNSGKEKSRILRTKFFLARLDFSPSPLTAPGSPMRRIYIWQIT